MQLEIALDVNQPEKLIAFWSKLLGYVMADEARFDAPNRTYWSLIDPSGHGPRLVIQRVPEPAAGKSRLHLDLHVPDIEAEALRAAALGATRIDTEPMSEVGAAWIRMQDPEGNIFCLVRGSPA